MLIQELILFYSSWFFSFACRQQVKFFGKFLKNECIYYFTQILSKWKWKVKSFIRHITTSPGTRMFGLNDGIAQGINSWILLDQTRQYVIWAWIVTHARSELLIKIKKTRFSLLKKQIIARSLLTSWLEVEENKVLQYSFDRRLRARIKHFLLISCLLLKSVQSLTKSKGVGSKNRSNTY